MNQSKIIENCILQLLDEGFTDKQAIYSRVVERINVPRPTVRRVARDLIMDLERKVKILKSDYPPINPGQTNGDQNC